MKLSTLTLLAVSAFIVVGCGKGNFSERNNQVQENVLRYPVPNNPTSLDPGIVQDGDTLDMLQQVYEGLVGWDENNNVVPLVAERWEVSDDGTEYTFFIREGVKFHNGRQVTAEDIKWSIERAARPAFKSTTADAYLSDVIGVTEMVNGQAESIPGIEVVDDMTVKFKLKQPTPYFLGKLTYMVSYPVPKEVVPEDSELTDYTKAVGCGPYKLVKYDDKQLAVLEPYEDYWGGKPALTRIERPIMLDPTTRLTKYKNGEVDLVQLQRSDIEGVKKDFGDQLVYLDRPAIWYVGLNQEVYAPFKDKRVRQAFAMAIDRDKIVNVQMGGVNTLANTIVPPGVRGHRDKGAGFDYNVEAAQKLLADAGFPGGKGMPALTLTHREGYTDIKLVAESVASQIEANLGVKVEVQPMEWRKYLEDYNNKKHAFYHMRWAADYLDPQNFLSHMLATWGPENKLGYSSPQFDALCKQADTLLDWDARVPLYQQAEDVVLQDAVWIPIYFQRDVELQSPRLQNMRESLFGHLPHTTTTVADVK
ncbi:MAG: ABC transporter substrate-binding protein [Armatimonadetes bacterium]|nr:ABC transporter substrate-binding protein [Armatimonadota bacterium]